MGKKLTTSKKTKDMLVTQKQIESLTGLSLQTVSRHCRGQVHNTQVACAIQSTCTQLAKDNLHSVLHAFNEGSSAIKRAIANTVLDSVLVAHSGYDIDVCVSLLELMYDVLVLHGNADMRIKHSKRLGLHVEFVIEGFFMQVRVAENSTLMSKYITSIGHVPFIADANGTVSLFTAYTLGANYQG